MKDKWSPALQIRTVLLSIQALLSAPNPDDPLANDVAEQWKSNEAQAIRTGKLARRHSIICVYNFHLPLLTLKDLLKYKFMPKMHESYVSLCVWAVFIQVECFKTSLLDWD